MWLTIKDIKEHINIGCYNWEENIKRLIIISLKVKITGETFDYEDLQDIVKTFICSKKFSYIEDLCIQLTNCIAKTLDPEEFILNIQKPNIIKFLHSAKISNHYKR